MKEFNNKIEEQVTYVFQLPAAKILELSDILDAGNQWEQLSFLMPDVCDVDIDACRRLKTGERPTEALLRIWGSKGYTIFDLFKLFFQAKLFRCMQTVKEFVDKKYHKFILADYFPATTRSSINNPSDSVVNTSNIDNEVSFSSNAIQAGESNSNSDHPNEIQLLLNSRRAQRQHEKSPPVQHHKNNGRPSTSSNYNRGNNLLSSSASSAAAPFVYSKRTGGAILGEPSSHQHPSSSAAVPSLPFAMAAAATNSPSPSFPHPHHSPSTSTAASHIGSILALGIGGEASRQNRNLLTDGDLMMGLQNTVVVGYKEIQEATEDFSPNNIIGKGGYGVVYRGIWKHTDVAVKRIQSKSNSRGHSLKERIKQTIQELKTLGKYRHENILSLYGYSVDGPEPCLIYQLMPNGSLESRLLCRGGTDPLSWTIRLRISRGISCALNFLHSIGNVPVIHGDVKSANILLDRHMEPKLGDFGLSRDGQVEEGGSIPTFDSSTSIQRNNSASSPSRSNNKNKNRQPQAPMIATHVKGTLAYLPPEFTASRILTTKLDVYSFGVVLLEMATGQRAYQTERDPPGLVDYVVISYRQLLRQERKRQKFQKHRFQSPPSPKQASSSSHSNSPPPPPPPPSSSLPRLPNHHHNHFRRHPTKPVVAQRLYMFSGDDDDDDGDSGEDGCEDNDDELLFSLLLLDGDDFGGCHTPKMIVEGDPIQNPSSSSSVANPPPPVGIGTLMTGLLADPLAQPLLVPPPTTTIKAPTKLKADVICQPTTSERGKEELHNSNEVSAGNSTPNPPPANSESVSDVMKQKQQQQQREQKEESGSGTATAQWTFAQLLRLGIRCTRRDRFVRPSFSELIGLLTTTTAPNNKTMAAETNSRQL